MRKFLAGLSVVAVAVLVTAFVQAATAKEAPKDIVIDDCQAKQAAVNFPHAAHNETIECAKCHHTQPDLKAGGDMMVEKCGTCHNEPEKETTPVCSQMSPTKNPYHISCMGCHKETAKADPTTKAPTKCTGCHPKA